MARYRGPATKIARKFGEPIFGFDKAFDRRNYPPGQHGLAKKRKTASEYSIQLKEKQKAKYTYGMLERQFRNLFEKASRKHGVTGAVLLQLLESRLDNVVFRLGLASTRRAARQMVLHRHITVNGGVLNVPSYLLKPGEIIGIKSKSQELDFIKSAMGKKGKQYPWIDWNNSSNQGTFIAYPEREQIPENINEQLIVELYSK